MSAKTMSVNAVDTEGTGLYRVGGISALLLGVGGRFVTRYVRPNGPSQRTNWRRYRRSSLLAAGGEGDPNWHH